jgi:hypothetical protein
LGLPSHHDFRRLAVLSKRRGADEISSVDLGIRFRSDTSDDIRRGRLQSDPAGAEGRTNSPGVMNGHRINENDIKVCQAEADRDAWQERMHGNGSVPDGSGVAPALPEKVEKTWAVVGKWKGDLPWSHAFGFSARC